MMTLNEIPPLAPAPPRWRWLSLGAIAFIAVLILRHVTDNAMGIGVDSVDYIAGAWNLNNGRGLSMPSGEGGLDPITHFPPLTSVFLAAGEWLGVEVVQWARWTSIAFFAASAVLAAHIAVRHARTVWPGLIAGLLIITDIDMIKNHALVGSEPCFFFLTFLSLWWLITYLENPRRSLFIGSSVAAALALLTRYPGVVLAPVGMLCILLLEKGPRRRRNWKVILYGAVALLPGAAWALHNRIVAGTATDREFAFHMPTAWTLRQGVSTTLSWFMPQLAHIGHQKRSLACILLVIAVIVFLIRRKKPLGGKIDASLKPSFTVLLSFTLLYAMLVAATLLFFDAATPLDGRILLPIYIPMLLFAAISLNHLLSFVPNKCAISIAFIALVAVMLAARIRAAERWIATNRDEEKMLSIKPWATSEIFAYLHTVPTNSRIVSNETSALYFYNGLLVWEPPDKWNYYTRKINHNYNVQLAEMAAFLKKDGGLIVYFNHDMIPYRTDLPRLEELLAVVPTREILRTPEGVVLDVPPGK